MKKKDYIEKFVWGPVTNTFEFDDILIIEYTDEYDISGQPKTFYHADLILENDEIHNLMHTFDNKDKAMIFAIAYKYEKSMNGQASSYFYKMIGLE